jgi:hypothetical protein
MVRSLARSGVVVVEKQMQFALWLKIVGVAVPLGAAYLALIWRGVYVGGRR